VDNDRGAHKHDPGRSNGRAPDARPRETGAIVNVSCPGQAAPAPAAQHGGAGRKSGRGGQTFTAWLTATLGLSSPSWRLLCGVASVCSLMATISTQLLKSHNIEENVVKAQACSAKLEVIETGLALGQLDVKQATDHYLRCVEDSAFLDA